MATCFLLIYSILSSLFLTVSFAQQKTLRLSGISKSKPRISNVLPNEIFKVQVFGRNIPSSGFFFTTATRCEDYKLTNVSGVSTVAARVVSTDCSSAIISLPRGLPFNVSSSTYHLCHKSNMTGNEPFLLIHKEELDDINDHIGNQVLLCCFCILMSAYSSGMTLGYMKFSIVELNRMILQGGPQAKPARRIMRFRRRSNWLVIAFSLFSSVFTVLFTMNVESLLDNVPNKGILKIIVPTLILFIFAEMLPQAICNSKFGFNLASGLWFVSVLIFIVTFPIAYPASLILGRYLKRNVREVLTQEEKTCMIRNMAKNANANEKTIMENATTFSWKRVEELMVPIQQVFMLSRSQRLNRSTILTLVEKGYTRVPICDEKNKDTIVGMLNMKDLNLVTCDLSKEPTVKEVLRQIEKVKEANNQPKFAAKYVNVEMNAQLLLDQMRTGDFHFACVVKYMSYESKIVGIITIEDILEELFGKIDSSNENRLRSSVDDRGDNAIIGWCREAGTEKKYPLLFSQQLRVLQYLLKECTVFQKLEIGILKAKQLLSLDRIRIATKGEMLPVEEVLAVVWKGTILVKNAEETFVQNVAVPPKGTISTESSQKRPTVPVYIIGKHLLNKLSESLSCPFEEKIEAKDVIERVTVLSEEASYFKLRLEDLLNTINGAVFVKKNERKQTESFLQRLSLTPTVSPAKPESMEPFASTPTESFPLLGDKPS